MEFKKKTIIWEDNNEPPKSYIWAKPDGRFYEYSATKGWTESKLISSNGSSSEDVLSKFNEYKESLERDGYIFNTGSEGELNLLPIEIYEQSKDELPLNTILYGNPETAASMAMFAKPNSENPEDLESASYAIVFLSEEEVNALEKDAIEKYSWNFDKMWNGNNFRSINPWSFNSYSELVSTKLPSMYENWIEHSIEELYALDLNAQTWIRKRYFDGSIKNIMIENGYNLLVLIDSNNNNFVIGNRIVVKVYNENETYYIPGQIGSLSQ